MLVRSAGDRATPGHHPPTLVRLRVALCLTFRALSLSFSLSPTDLRLSLSVPPTPHPIFPCSLLRGVYLRLDAATPYSPCLSRAHTHTRFAEIYVRIYAEPCENHLRVCTHASRACARVVALCKSVRYLAVYKAVRKGARTPIPLAPPSFRLFSSRSRGLHTLNHP